MKLFLILIVFFCCVLIGILIKKYYQKRQSFFNDLNAFCENLSNDISYNNEKLDLIISKNLKLFNNDINFLFSYFKEYVSGGITEKKFEELIYKKFNYLQEKEKIEITKFFVSLGSFAKEEELQKISNFTNLIKPINKETTEKNKKFSSLYFKLFLSLGIILIIIFI